MISCFKINRHLFTAGLFLLVSCGHPQLETVVPYHIQLGMGYLKQNDMPRAKRNLLMALDEMHDSPDSYGAMAYYFEKTGNTKEAARFYKKALSVNPHYGPALNNYGAFLCRQGAYGEADKYFQKAVFEPRYEHPAEAYENAGLCAQLIPDSQKARHYFIKALKEDPLRQSTLRSLIDLERAQKHPEQAEKYLNRYQTLKRSEYNP